MAYNSRFCEIHGGHFEKECPRCTSAAELTRLRAALAAAEERVKELEANALASLEANGWVMVPKDCRTWECYPIEMPISATGHGPARIGKDAVKMTYEVWDQLLSSHASHDNLPDAINDAMTRAMIAARPRREGE